ncbi:helix-turn-helix transcriptional regulator [Nocardiopsis sp. CT-R113]|uniref:Helix-turn-helix transcriptional regulator n=1 Tax=Nocardiopsis codii TaxID=3065942 RepID=A0ABU7K1T3_9ACTN|nr:helix-turn-helix transcriptional regulator [Nocardiopsis sp. CT-R113]MEE2036203.1 helix-turn-helix transcriptional regulator [Nocardiopsis sp. CT-R113]
MSLKANPRRKSLGRKIAAARSQAGMTQGEVAFALKVVQSTVSAWEKGRRGLPSDRAAELDDLFDSGGAINRAWNSANEPDALPPWYTEVGQLEREATELREYQPVIFPGLVQCENYARGLLADTVPWFSPREIDQMVTLRMARQGVLARPENPPLVSIVIEEPVLRRTVQGGKGVLREQLATVVGLIERGEIRFQVIPDDAECHPGGSGPFRLYTFPDKPVVASAEHMEGEQLMDGMMQVQHCATLFGVLQAEALSPRASRELIRKVREELDDEA